MAEHQHEATSERLTFVAQHFEELWGGLVTTLRIDFGMDAEQIGKLWWLQIETAIVNWQLGAHYALRGIDHPWLRDDFSKMDEHLVAAVRAAREAFEPKEEA